MFLDLNPSDYEKAQPIITGTVVQDRDYGRKLKMIRADIFASMLLCQTESIFSSNQQMHKFKQAVCKVVKLDQSKIPKELEYLLSGWNKVLWDLCYVNSQRDVTTVNLIKE